MHVTQWPLVLQSCIYIPTNPVFIRGYHPKKAACTPLPPSLGLPRSHAPERHAVCPPPSRDVGASLGRSTSLVCHWLLQLRTSGAATPFLSLCLSAFVLTSSVHHSCYCCFLSALGLRDHRTESREIHLLFFFFFHTKTEIVDFTQHTSVPSHFLSSPFHLCVQTLIPATVRFTQARIPCRS